MILRFTDGTKGIAFDTVREAWTDDDANVAHPWAKRVSASDLLEIVKECDFNDYIYKEAI